MLYATLHIQLLVSAASTLSSFSATKTNPWHVPQTLEDHSTGFDAQESVLGGGGVEASRLSVGEERVRPPDPVEHLVPGPDLVEHVVPGPDPVEHLVTDAQLVAAVVESQSVVVPVLAEVEIHREILPCNRPPLDR